MATNCVLATQFLERLNVVDDLEKQLCLAFKTLSSFDLPLTKKEEIILGWLIDCIKLSSNESNPENFEKLITLYETLHKCLACPQMKTDRIDIKTSICDNIIKVTINEGLKSQLPQLQKISYKCVLQMLDSPIFSRIFKQDSGTFLSLMTTFFVCSSNFPQHSALPDDYVLALKLITSIFQKTLSKHTFQAQFVKKTMPKIIASSVELENDDFDKEISKCLQQILFDRTASLNYVAAIKDPNANENSVIIIKRILKLPKSSAPEIVEKFYSMFLRLGSKKFKNEKQTFEMFLSLSLAIGFIPLEQDAKRHLERVEEFKGTGTMLKMLTVLKEANVPLDTEVDEIQFSKWLISLLKCTLYSGRSLESDQLKLVGELFSFLDPIVVEQMFPHFVSNTILQNKISNELRDVYSGVLAEILSVFAKLSRVHKFISKMLEEIIIFLQSNNNPDLPLMDILPEKFFRSFDKAVASQPVAGSFLSMTTLRFYLEKILLPKVETEPFNEIQGNLILIDVIFELTSHLLNNMYVADESISNIVQEKFIDTFDELAKILHRFGKVLLENKFNMRATKAFFNLSYTWGALNLLLITYKFEEKELIEGQENSDAKNLSYVLHFLPDNSWELLTTRVINRGDEELKYILYKLMIQKMDALRAKVCFEPANNVAHFLLDNADSNWLCENANTLPFFLERNELLRLSEILLKCKHPLKLMELIKTEDFQESSDMVAAMSLTILEKIADEFHESGQQILKNIMLNMDLEMLVGEEADHEVHEEMLKRLEDSAKALSKGLRKSSDSIIIPTHSMESKIALLSNLPLSCLQNNTQVAIFLPLVAIAHCLEYNTAIFDLLGSILDSDEPIKLPEKVDWKILIHRIYSKSQEYCFRDTLIECLFKAALRSNADIQKVISSLISSPSEDSMAMSSMISQILPKMIRKKRNADGGLKDTLQKCENDLRLCLRNISEVKPEIRWVPSFRAAIHYHLKSNSGVDKDEVNKLSKLIPPYLDLIFKRIADTEETHDLEVEGSFLELILQNKKHLEFDLPNNIGTLWTKLASRLPVQNLQTFLQFVNIEQFSSILESLKDITTLMIDETELNDKVFLLWRVLVIAQLSVEKEALRNAAVNHLSDVLLQLTFTWKKSGSIMNVHKLLIAFTSAVKVKMTSEHIEMCLEVINATPRDSKPELLERAVDLLSHLLRYRTSLMLDHIPQLLQQMSHLISIVSRASHLSDMKFSAEELASVAFSIEKLANVMVTEQKRHFSRVAHYFVANVLCNFEEWTVEYSVQVHLQNVLFSFLSLCDHHAIAFLMRSLPTTPQLMFKDLHERFNKYHKFSGRI